MVFCLVIVKVDRFSCRLNDCFTQKLCLLLLFYAKTCVFYFIHDGFPFILIEYVTFVTTNAFTARASSK